MKADSNSWEEYEMKRAYQITVVVIAVLILGGMLIYLLPSKATGKIIEQAIEKSGRQVEKVIHEEKVKDGEVVFFYESINAGKDSTMANYRTILPLNKRYTLSTSFWGNFRFSNCSG